MLLHPTKPELRLFEIKDVDSDRWQHHLPWRSAPYYLATARWIETYLCEPHEDLGRRGAVCPFVRSAIDKGTLWLTGCERLVETADELADFIRPYRDWLPVLPPTHGDDQNYKTILMVCSTLQSPEGIRIIDDAQRLLKPAFVQEGYMVGQFHPFCQETGVRNSDFCPLRSPVGMLVIRSMVAADLPFLTAPPFFAVYKSRFGGAVPDRLRTMYADALRRNEQGGGGSA